MYNKSFGMKVNSYN